MDRYSVARVSGPSDEVITRAEARLHLKIDSDQTADDALIDLLTTAAREDAEDFCNRCFVYSTWELRLDEFPSRAYNEILLPRPPLISVNSVKYIDANGATQTLGSDNWYVDAKSEPARLRPAYGLAWPATRAQMNAVTVSYLAGYPPIEAGSPLDTTTNVPAAAKAAVKLILGHLYANREAVMAMPGGVAAIEIPMGAQYLLWKLRVQDYRLSH
mgnify:FL=1